MRRRWFLLVGVVLVACSTSFCICEAGANTETEETLTEEVERPEWKVGDYWVYKVTHIMESEEKKGYNISLKVVGKGELEETECYILSGTDFHTYYYTLDLNLKADVRSILFKKVEYTPDSMDYNWPLKVGGEWEYSYTKVIESQVWETQGKPRKKTFAKNGVVEVVGVEEVEVPAGKFLTLKLERRILENNTLFLKEEYWYSPRGKNFVKQKIYLKNAVVDGQAWKATVLELTEYGIDQNNK